MDEGLGQFGECEEKGRMVGVTRIPGGDIQVDDTEGARGNFSSEE